jgi:hypothetical protein
MTNETTRELRLRAEINPLAIFTALTVELSTGQTAAVTFDAPPSPKQREALRSLAGRCGLTAERDSTTALYVRKAEIPPFQINGATEADVPEIGALFDVCFPHDKFSAPLWRWKYANPLSFALVMRRDGRLIAHYGGRGHRADFRGETIPVVEATDVMVHPDARGAVSFPEIAKALQEVYFGWWPGGAGFGFPNEHHMRRGEKIGVYSEVDSLVEVQWAAGAAASVTHDHHPIRAEDAGTLQPRVDALWREMRSDFHDDLLSVRDWQYLESRYLRHPTRRYDVHLVGNSSQPVGVVVLGPDQTGPCELLDVFGRKADLSQIVAVARALTAQRGQAVLSTWTTRSHAALLEVEGSTVNSLDLRIGASCWIEGTLPVEQARGKWWVTSGDQDCR